MTTQRRTLRLAIPFAVARDRRVGVHQRGHTGPVLGGPVGRRPIDRRRRRVPVRGRLGRRDGGARRRRQGRGRPDDHRPAARLVQLRRDARPASSRSTGITDQRAEPGRAARGDEIEAIKANKDNKGPQAPDVIDVGLSFGPQAKTDGLIQPYKVATWDTIPDAVKDADGYWYGDYYGVLSFEVEHGRRHERRRRTGPTCSSPSTRARSPSPATRASPTRPSRPSAPRRLANGGSLDNAQPGLDFFKQLNDAGNFVPIIAKTATRSPAATRRSRSAGPTTRSPTSDVGRRATRRSRSSSRRPAGSAACTSRRSAPTRRIRTPPSCGWSSSTPTRARTSG